MAGNAVRTWLAVTIALGAAALAGAGGYWAGFREGWSMGLRADAPVRGVIATGHLRLLEQGRTSDLKTSLDHDIDMGLILWHDLSDSRLRPMINALSGMDVYPAHERYVRRLATYRKTHVSPLFDSALSQSLLEGAAKVSPEVAEELRVGGERSRKAISDSISKYAE